MRIKTFWTTYTHREEDVEEDDNTIVKQNQFCQLLKYLHSKNKKKQTLWLHVQLHHVTDLRHDAEGLPPGVQRDGAPGDTVDGDVAVGGGQSQQSGEQGALPRAGPTQQTDLHGTPDQHTPD